MGWYVLLDAGPVGLACCHPSQPAAGRCLDWLENLRDTGAMIVLPAITEYEVRRELLRIGAGKKLRNLADLKASLYQREITGAALDRAAEFRAAVRRAGMPTAGPDSLDADAILAGMAATCGRPGDRVSVATTSVRHLSRFPGVDARPWDTLL